MAIFWEMPGHAQDRTRHFDAPAPTVSKKKCQIPLIKVFGRKPGLTAFRLKKNGRIFEKKPKKLPSQKGASKKGLFFLAGHSGIPGISTFSQEIPEIPEIPEIGQIPRNSRNSQKMTVLELPGPILGPPDGPPDRPSSRTLFWTKLDLHRTPPQDPQIRPRTTPDPSQTARSRPRISQISPSHTSFRSLVSAG